MPCLQKCGPTRRRCRKARRDQAGAGAGVSERIEIFRVVEKADVGRPGAIERRDIADAAVGRIAVTQLGVRQRRNLGDRQLAIGFDKSRHAYPL